MYIHLMVEKQFGPERREQSILLPANGIFIEQWMEGNLPAPNCCKITCQGLAFKVKGKTCDELTKAIGMPVKDLLK